MCAFFRNLDASPNNRGTPIRCRSSRRRRSWGTVGPVVPTVVATICGFDRWPSERELMQIAATQRRGRRRPTDRQTTGYTSGPAAAPLSEHARLFHHSAITEALPLVGTARRSCARSLAAGKLFVKLRAEPAAAASNAVVDSSPTCVSVSSNFIAANRSILAERDGRRCAARALAMPPL